MVLCDIAANRDFGYISIAGIVVIIVCIIIEYVVRFITSGTGKGSSVPVCQCTPGIAVACNNRIRLENRYIGCILCNRRMESGTDANIFCTPQFGQIQCALAVCQIDFSGCLDSLAIV